MSKNSEAGEDSNIPQPVQGFPRPSDFMRVRRPELYSDSVEVEELLLERSRLEYHLDTLTSRNEDKPFEHYCRRLCEKLICPALAPQTGPTGGGDSKVDADSYPVTEAVAERWYVGDADATSNRRLAFAFSAKKDWLTKIKKDVASIVSTGRNYSHIYFLTNQAVPDKKRAKTEDDLKKKYGIGVSIFDRTWLVEKTLSAKHVDIAVSTLGIGD